MLHASKLVRIAAGSAALVVVASGCSEEPPDRCAVVRKYPPQVIVEPEQPRFTWELADHPVLALEVDPPLGDEELTRPHRPLWRIAAPPWQPLVPDIRYGQVTEPGLEVNPARPLEPGMRYAVRLSREPTGYDAAAGEQLCHVSAEFTR